MIARVARTLGLLMIVAGVAAVAWALIVWQWEDPFTSLYTTYQQRKLASSYEKQVAAYHPPPAKRAAPRQADVGTKRRRVVLEVERRRVAREAKHYRGRLRIGDPVGRLKVPRMDLNVVVVNGTDTHTLKRGPGRHEGAFVPGESELVYVAGHRTTYGAPFSKIDTLRPGDPVFFELPYATLVYEVRWHKIVPADDIGRLRSRHREVLALQACHPRFFASQRYIAYAVPIRVVPRNGRAYAVGTRLAATARS